MSRLCKMPGGDHENFDKVPCIKAFRQITGLGLKEAKDAVEAAHSGGTYALPGKTAPANCDAEIDVLNASGLMITGNATKVSFILRSLRANAKMAIDSGENNLAILILDALDRFEDSRNK